MWQNYKHPYIQKARILEGVQVNFHAQYSSKELQVLQLQVTVT